MWKTLRVSYIPHPRRRLPTNVQRGTTLATTFTKDRSEELLKREAKWNRTASAEEAKKDGLKMIRVLFITFVTWRAQLESRLVTYMCSAQKGGN
jgi:hypothetical protein